MAGQPRPRRHVRASLKVLVALLLFAAVPGCGLLGGSDAATNTNTSGAGVERSRITVGVLPVVDTAAIHMAIKKGYFGQEGLEVDLKTIQGGAAGITGIVSGDLNFTFGNWVSFFAAQAKGAADLKLVSDAYQAGPNTFLIMTAPDSTVKSPVDLAGKVIGVNTRANVAELATRSTLEANGVDASTVTFKELPFPDMSAALQRKDVDAALLVEPFITRTERTIGAVPVVDAASGPANEIPIAGYATTAMFAAENPKTVAAFQRALAKGQADCGAKRQDVEQLLTEYAKIDKETASLVAIGTYPTTIEPTRLQRVVDLMKAYGLLSQPVDVNSMIWRAPAK